MAGFAFVMMLLITVIVEACTAGLPAIASGDFAVVGFSDICARLPSAPCLTAERPHSGPGSSPCVCCLQSLLPATRAALSRSGWCWMTGGVSETVRCLLCSLLCVHGQHHRLCLLHSAHRHAHAARDASGRGRLQDSGLVHAPGHRRCASAHTAATSLRIPRLAKGAHMTLARCRLDAFTGRSCQDWGA